MEAVSTAAGSNMEAVVTAAGSNMVAVATAQMAGITQSKNDDPFLFVCYLLGQRILTCS